MATLATIFDRFSSPRIEQAPPQARFLEPEDPFETPAFPNEDVYFYVKRIANTNVVRLADPAARKACWRVIGYSFVLAMLVISLLLPTLYDLMAGYRMEALRQERQRLEELARMQRFVDPAPESVVYLDTKSDSILAKK